MDQEIKNKIQGLINKTRVMTLAVSHDNIPWSSPVYFVFHDNRFYFFSNENARHIRFAKDRNMVSASIFHDSDQIDQIFGFQMSGSIDTVSKMTLYLQVVKKYVTKFHFLEQVFGPQVIENRHFFLERFKSHLYGFDPEQIFLSDNSRTSEKRAAIDLSQIV